MQRSGNQRPGEAGGCKSIEIGDVADTAAGIDFTVRCPLPQLRRGFDGRARFAADLEEIEVHDTFAPGVRRRQQFRRSKERIATKIERQHRIGPHRTDAEIAVHVGQRLAANDRNDAGHCGEPCDRCRVEESGVDPELHIGVLLA